MNNEFTVLSTNELEGIDGGFSFSSFAAGIGMVAVAYASFVAAAATAPTAAVPAALIVAGSAAHTAGIGMIAHSFVE